jgi:hypothetical protein
MTLRMFSGIRDVAVLVATIAVFGAVSGCRYPQEATELYGTYVADYRFGKEQLILKPSGEYQQEVRIVNKPSLTAAGRWSYDAATGYITMKNALVIADGFGNLKPDYDKLPVGDTVLPARRSLFGEIRIGGGEGIDYRKISK